MGTRPEADYILTVDDGAGAIPVAVRRGHVRNLKLRVRRDGSVALSVPRHTSRAQAQAFLDGRSGWIHKAVGRRAALDADALRLRDTYALWGVLQQVSDEAALSRAELDELLRDELARALPEVVRRMEPLVGAHACAWQLRTMTSRWGSCSPASGRIRINVRLAAYPPACLDYVVAHELTHLLEPSHNARFHALLARTIPNERAIRARLRQGPLGEGRANTPNL